MTPEEDLVLYQRDALRTGGIVLGAEPLSPWRPSDPHLRAIVDGVDILEDLTGARGAALDVGLLADMLRADDPAVDWIPLLRYLVDRWDEVRTTLAARAPALVIAREVLRRSAALARRVERFNQARAAAERAHADLVEACVAFEMEVAW